MGKTPNSPRDRSKGVWFWQASCRASRMLGGMDRRDVAEELEGEVDAVAGLTHRMPVRPRDLRVWVRAARESLASAGMSMAMKVRMEPVIGI